VTYDDDISEKIFKSVSEAPHEVRVALNRCPTLQSGNIVSAERNILSIAPSLLVGVRQVRILVNLFQSPRRQRNTGQDEIPLHISKETSKKTEIPKHYKKFQTR